MMKIHDFLMYVSILILFPSFNYIFDRLNITNSLVKVLCVLVFALSLGFLTRKLAEKSVAFGIAVFILLAIFSVGLMTNVA